MKSTASAKPRHYLKTARLHLVPATEIVADFEPRGQDARHNQRFDLQLDKDELVADGQDELAVVLYVHRVGAKPDQVYPGSRVTDVKLGGNAGPEYQLVEDQPFAAVPENQGRRRFTIRTKDNKPLLHTAARAAQTLTLDAEGQLSPQNPGKTATAKPPLSVKAQIPLKPCLIHLALWVVPGQIRGTSTVGVGSYLCRGQGPLLELKMAENDLEVKAVSEQLTLSFSHVTILCRTGGIRDLTAISAPPWLSLWRMAYSGATWANALKATVAVFCRVAGGDEAISFHIDMRQNVAEMINDIDTNSGKLELTNPEWQSDSPIAKFGMILARRELRGPVYNVREYIRRKWYEKHQFPLPPDLEKYTCGNLSLRLCRHVVARRNGTTDPDTALRMNGIEACQYVLEGCHDWFGFHLSGSGPGDDPIFIDPWWTQEWNVADVKDDYGFKKQAALIVAVFTLVVCESIVILYFLVWVIRATISQMAPVGWQVSRDGLVRTLAPARPLPQLISLPGLLEAKEALDASRAAHAAAAAAVAASWTCLKPSNRNVQLFDDSFNYSHFDELGSFNAFAKELQQGAPRPLTTEPWPA